MSATSASPTMRVAALKASLRGGFAADAIGTVVLNVVTIVVNFAMTLVLSRELGASGYGAFAFGLAWSAVLSVPAVLGLTPLVVRNVAAYSSRSDWTLLRGLLRRSNEVVLLTSVLVVGVGAIVGWVLVGDEPELFRPFLVALFLVPLVSLTTLRQSAMQGLGKVVVGRVPETLLAPLLFLVLVAAAAPALGDLFSATTAMTLQVGAQVVAFATGIVLLRRALPLQVRGADAEYETRVWLRSALPLFVMSALMALNAQVGTIFLGAMDGATAAGVYSVASKVALFTSFFWLAATYPLMPAVARLHAQGRRAELQRMLTRGAVITSVCAAVIALVLIVFSRQFLALFGQDFGEGVWPLRILALGELGKVLTGFAGLALVMTGFERDLTVGVAIGAVANVALSALLIPAWGVNGAAGAAAVSVVASNLFLAYLLWKRLRLISLPLALRL